MINEYKNKIFDLRHQILELQEIKKNAFDRMNYSKYDYIPKAKALEMTRKYNNAQKEIEKLEFEMKNIQNKLNIEQRKKIAKKTEKKKHPKYLPSTLEAKKRYKEDRTNELKKRETKESLIEKLERYYEIKGIKKHIKSKSKHELIELILEIELDPNKW